MATYNLHRTQQPLGGNIKQGLNWVHIRIDFSKQNCAQNDDLKLLEVKNHWILSEGWTRITTATDGASTMDLGTAAGGNQLDDAIDIDSASDTWTAMDTLAVETGIAITADGYIYARVLDAAVSSGIVDVMLAIIVPAWDSEVDSIAE